MFEDTSHTTHICSSRQLGARCYGLTIACCKASPSVQGRTLTHTMQTLDGLSCTG